MRRAAHIVSRRTVARRHLHTKPTHADTVQITTLPNKIRVATESTPGHFSAVGLYVDAGSRYETPESLGVSHFLDRMAFKSTKNRSSTVMSSDIHALGGQIHCSSSRETIMYQSAHFHKGTPQALSLISDTVLNPAFLEEEIIAQRDATQYEVREVYSKPELYLPEVLHHVAYSETDLGISLLCPDDRIQVIDAQIMQDFMKEWYRPERMVIAGAGMHHQELVELADKFFSSLRSNTAPSPQNQAQPLARQSQVPTHLLPSSSPSLYKSLTRAASYLYPNTPLDPLSAAQHTNSLPSTYTGGHLFLHDPNSEFNHIYLAFEGFGIHDPDIYTLATIQVLLGGGGSFSAGGPGKGMYSRLYTHILNHYPQIDHCEAFHHIYADSSLFGLFASFVPASSRRHGNSPSQIMPHLVHQFSSLIHTPVQKHELQKAKNQLKSSLTMALESRSIEVEDLGRQILVHNRKVPVSEMSDRIDEVTPEDVMRVAHRVFGEGSAKKATVVTSGHDDVLEWRSILKKYGVGGS